MITAYCAVTAACFFIVFKSADIIVRSSSALARAWGVSGVFIGVALIGFGTSAPEILVTAVASLTGHPQIVIGNASGSIAANAGIAAALIFWLVSRRLSRSSGEREINGKFIIINTLFLPVAAAVMYFTGVGRVSRSGGLLLLAAVAVYLFLSSGRRPAGDEAENPAVSVSRELAFFSAGLAALLVSSRLVVWAASGLARLAGVSEFIIAATIVAVGTSLPEIATSVSATRSGEYGMAVGDIAGSQVFNLFLLPGLAALAGSITIDRPGFVFGWIFIVLAELMLFIKAEKIPPALKAAVLFFTYVLYVISNVKVFSVIH